MYITVTQAIIFIILYTIGIRLLMGNLIRQNQLTVADFIMTKDGALKKVLKKLTDSTFDGFELLEQRIINLEEQHERKDN